MEGVGQGGGLTGICFGGRATIGMGDDVGAGGDCFVVPVCEREGAEIDVVVRCRWSWISVLASVSDL